MNASDIMLGTCACAGVEGQEVEGVDAATGRKAAPSYQLECQQNAAIPLLQGRHFQQTAREKMRAKEHRKQRGKRPLARVAVWQCSKETQR